MLTTSVWSSRTLSPDRHQEAARHPTRNMGVVRRIVAAQNRGGELPARADSESDQTLLFTMLRLKGRPGDFEVQQGFRDFREYPWSNRHGQGLRTPRAATPPPQ